jgi:hypothetical protein
MKKSSDELAAEIQGYWNYLWRPHPENTDACTEITISQARTYAQHDGSLSLNSLRTITADVSQELAAHVGGVLSLSRLWPKSPSRLSGGR